MSLRDYYVVCFQLVHQHKYSLTELESIMPWERDIYLTQVITYIKGQNEKIKQRIAEKNSTKGFMG